MCYTLDNKNDYEQIVVFKRRKVLFLDNINFGQLIDKVNKQFHDCNVSPPTNTIAHIFRKESQENFISDWIAYLIDPVSFGNAEPLL